MNIVVIVLTALLVCLSCGTGFGIELGQTSGGCVEYFLKNQPGEEHLNSKPL